MPRRFPLSPLGGMMLGAALLAAPQGLGSPAWAQRRARAEKKTPVHVVVAEKSILRAEPSEIGRPLAKLRPKEKFDLLQRSEDNMWVQVRKGRILGWIPVGDLEAVPLPDGAVPDEAAKTEPVKPEAPAATTGTAGKGTPAATTGTAGKGTPAATTGTAGRGTGRTPPPPPPTPVVVTPPPPPPPQPVAVTPVPPPPAAPPPPPAAPTPPQARLPLAGFWINAGGGLALMNSSFSSTFKSGLTPELYNYSIDGLAALGAQARVGYTFGHRWLRVGVDAGYRFGGATTVVVKFAPKIETVPGSSPPQTISLLASRQEDPVTSHDADAAFSIGGYFAPSRLFEMTARLRAGVEFQAFLPQVNPQAILPQDLYYGPHVGGIVEFQSRFLVGFGARLEGGYMPYLVHQQNTCAHDAAQLQVVCVQPGSTAPTLPAGAMTTGGESSKGYFIGVSGALRVVSGFDIEVAYRLVSTSTSYPADTLPERLQFDRDPLVKNAALSQLLTGASRSFSQHLITLGVAFRR